VRSVFFAMATFGLPFQVERLSWTASGSAVGNILAASGIWRMTQVVFEFMKILLQHVRTQLYVRGLGNWTANPAEAHDFQHSQRAIDFARDHGLTAVQIAVKFVDAQFDEVFPLPSVATRTAQPAQA